MGRELFQVYRRSGSPYYFARFWDEEAGRYTGGRSTKETRKGRARDRAKEMQAAGGAVPKEQDRIILEFLREYWQAPKKKVGESHRRRNAAYIEKRIAKFKPFSTLRFSTIRRFHLVRLATFLREEEGMSPRSINLAMCAVTKPLNWAHAGGYIAQDVAHGLEHEEEDPEERGALTLEEVTRLIGLEVEDLRLKAGVLLGCLAGLRLGEIRALPWKHVDFERRVIEVRTNFVDSEGFKKPKRGSKREVEMVDPLRAVLLALREHLLTLRAGKPTARRSAPADWVGPDALVIASAQLGRPVGKHLLEDAFREQLGQIGISEEQQEERNLTFHGTRHAFTSWAREALPDFITMKLTGHKTKAMLERYSHRDPSRAAAIRAKMDEHLKAGRATAGGEPAEAEEAAQGQAG